MPYMYSEMQNKLSKTRDSPLESMGQIISSRCPLGYSKKASSWDIGNFLSTPFILLRFFSNVFITIHEYYIN